MSERFHDGMTLGEARPILRDLADDGHDCPLCTQLVKVYRRKVHASMARVLILVYRAHGRDWFHLPSHEDASKLGGDFAKMAYWGLVQESEEQREDGGRAGWWRVTALGELWVRGEEFIPKYARIYDGRRMSLTGDPVSIRDALGDRFDYRELMEGL